MRKAPEYPVWETASAPNNRRWLQAGALISLLAGGAGALTGEANRSAAAFAVMWLALVFIGFLWLCRLLYFRFSLHHAIAWQRNVRYEQNLWWEEHQSLIGLKDILLLGPAGAETMDWQRVLRRIQRPPVERHETGGKTLRIARTFSADSQEREQQLVRALVMQWKTTSREMPQAISRCFFLGDAAVWSAFRAQMHDAFPEVNLPDQPEPWEGEATLARLTALLREDAKSQHLVVGCVSCPASPDSLLPAGESAALWLVGADAPVVMPRGEFYDASASDPLRNICERAVTQCELDEDPATCILFSHPQIPQVNECGWNTTHNLQDNYWGIPGSMEPLIVISLAALYAQNEAQPCGWISTDPRHTLALGIVKPHGKG